MTEFVAKKVTHRRFVLMDDDSLRAHAAKHLGDAGEWEVWKELLGRVPADFRVPGELSDWVRVVPVSRELEEVLQVLGEVRQSERLPSGLSDVELLLVLGHLPWSEGIKNRKHLPAAVVQFIDSNPDEVRRLETHPALAAARDAARAVCQGVPKSTLSVLSEWQVKVPGVKQALERFWSAHPELLQAYGARAVQAVLSGAEAPRHAEYLERGEFANESYFDDAGVFCVLHGGTGAAPHRLATAFIPDARAAKKVRREVTSVQELIRNLPEAPGPAQEMFRKRASSIQKRDAIRDLRFSSPKTWGLDE